MADENPESTKRRNHPSSSNSAKFHNPSNSFTNVKDSQPRSYVSRNTFTKKATSSNWESVDDVFKNSGAHQDAPVLVGSCPFMCPEEERARREKLRDLAVFERLHGNPTKSSPHLAVKKFCRTITSRDMKASDVRPVSVLEVTLNYLINILDSSQFPFEVVHDFIFDRTRCIRQDLTMQNAMGDQVVRMYERIVMFHITSHHHLNISPDCSNIASMRYLNMEQLMKALTTLLNLYEESRSLHSIHNNEAEFHSFYVLLHLGSNKQENESLSLWFRRIPSLIMTTKEMRFARRILRYFRLCNYKKFIHTVEEEASSLQYYIVEPYINEVRVLALSCVSYGGYKLQPYPLSRLSKLLIMKESDVESLCVQYGLAISTVGTEKGLLCTKQSVCKPTGDFEKYYPMDSKRIESFEAKLY